MQEEICVRIFLSSLAVNRVRRARPAAALALVSLFLLSDLRLGAAEFPEPTRVSLDDQSRPLGDILATIAKQTNIPIDAGRAVKDRIVRLRLDNVPLWEALQRIASASKHRLVVGPQSGTIAMVDASRDRPDVSDVRGPFRFAVRGVQCRLDFETGQSSCEVQIDLVWEPRFKAFHAEIPAKAVSVADPSGKHLTVAADASGKMPVTGAGLEFTVRLPNVPRGVPKIGRLDGEIRLVGTAQSVQFSLDPAQTGQRQQRAEIGCTLTRFSKAGRLWRAVVELEYPKGGPEFESFESYLRDNEVWLLRPDGAKFRPTGFELGAEHAGKTAITYFFKEDDKDGPILNNLKDWRLVVRAPGRIFEAPVKFELRDIPLP
jgi:hypothetical protein